MLRKALIIVFAFWLNSFSLFGQDLEPRALTNLPIGTNVVVASYGYAQGNILIDPAIPIEGLKAKIHSGVFAYVRAINFFGLSGKVDVVIPYAYGNWAGNYIGVDTTTSRHGFADSRFRLSFNFVGAPALERAEFASYKPGLISGFSLLLVAPTGQYFDDKLINLGSNRWVFKPQWGIANNFKHWVVEGYLAARIFTKNSSFFNGGTTTQKPLYAVKVHLIRKLPKRMWLAIDFGYGIGGRITVNEIQQETQISNTRFGIHYSVPLAIHHSLRFSFISGIVLEDGSDFDAFVLTYQYIWNRKSIK